jgi:hypothetical protein
LELSGAKELINEFEDFSTFTSRISSLLSVTTARLIDDSIRGLGGGSGGCSGGGDLRDFVLISFSVSSPFRIEDLVSSRETDLLRVVFLSLDTTIRDVALAVI